MKNGVSEEYVDIKKQGRQMRFNRTGYWRAQRATGSGVAAITVTHQLRPKVMLRAYYLCGPPRLMAKLSCKCSIYSGILYVARFSIFVYMGNSLRDLNEYYSWHKVIEMSIKLFFLLTSINDGLYFDEYFKVSRFICTVCHLMQAVRFDRRALNWH